MIRNVLFKQIMMKINIDSDHLSIAGAKFIGNRIFDLNWLNLN